MPIRAIAFDLDDTLLRPDASVSDYTVDVLRRAAERDIIILPASPWPCAPYPVQAFWGSRPLRPGHKRPGNTPGTEPSPLFVFLKFISLSLVFMHNTALSI